MSEAASSIKAQSWPWGSQIAVKKTQCECNVGRYLSATPVDQLQRRLSVRFHSTLTLHLVRSWCIGKEGQTSFEFSLKNDGHLALAGEQNIT